MSSRSRRTRFDGTTRTRTGRVVYNRKPHFFSGRDAARVTRQALNFPDIDIMVWTGYGLSKMDEYAKFNFQSFCDWAGAWNFLPKSMITWSWDESPVEDYAYEVASKIAGWLGVPDSVLELAGWIYGEFISGRFSGAFTIRPEYIASIVRGANQNTKFEGEIYGRKSKG